MKRYVTGWVVVFWVVLIGASWANDPFPGFDALVEEASFDPFPIKQVGFGKAEMKEVMASRPNRESPMTEVQTLQTSGQSSDLPAGYPTTPQTGNQNSSGLNNGTTTRTMPGIQSRLHTSVSGCRGNLPANYTRGTGCSTPMSSCSGMDSGSGCSGPMSYQVVRGGWFPGRGLANFFRRSRARSNQRAMDRQMRRSMRVSRVSGCS